MKNLILALTLLASLTMSQQSYCQVNMKQLKNEAKISLDNYIFESMAYKEYSEFENRKVVKASFDIFSNEEYRLVDISQGFTKKVIINIYDSKGKLFISNIYYQTLDTFDFKSKISGEYIIEFIFEKEDYNGNPKGKVVAFVLGYK